jgi:dGTPase
VDRWVDPSHCYAAGLAHDIGQPPLGHAGEEALQEMLDASAEEGLELWEDDGTDVRGPVEPAASDIQRIASRSFEGNAQSRRVVAKLSMHAGLNLALRTLAGIAKYPWLRGHHPVGTDKLAKKWSLYLEERDILDRLVDVGFVRIESESRHCVGRRRDAVVVLPAAPRAPFSGSPRAGHASADP